VTRLVVRAGDGTPVPVKQIARIPEFALFQATFGGTFEGFGYDAKDSAGTIIESAIT
jgi:hypothetical protein